MMVRPAPLSSTTATFAISPGVGRGRISKVRAGRGCSSPLAGPDPRCLGGRARAKLNTLAIAQQGAQPL